MQSWVWILFIIFFIWLTALSFLYFTAIRHYKKLTTKDGDSLEKAINAIFSGLKSLHDELTKVHGRVQNIEIEKMKHIQKVALKRFNPFGDTGGDQSFSLSLLDANNDGVVLSSLHGRSGTRIYAKPVKSGKPNGYELSTEEHEVINLAKKES